LLKYINYICFRLQLQT